MKKIITVLKTLKTGQFWYLFPHYYYLWKRSIDIEKTPACTTSTHNTPDVTEVHILTGKKQHIDLLYAAKSFVYHYQAPISLIIHTDTSVTEDVIKRINRHLPQAKIFTRKMRDTLVEPQLEKLNLQQCIKFRQINALAAKLIDAFLISKSDRFMILDTDCLAFKPLIKLRQMALSPTSQNVFSKDPQPNPYSLLPEELKSCFNVEVKPHLNVGLCIISRNAVDLYLVEKWLSNQEFPMNSYFAEQTIIAGLVSRQNVELLPETEYNTARLKDENTCSFIHYCGHYLGATRIAMRSIGQSLVLQQLTNNHST
ncbi:MAG: hypothetical protein IGS39_18840 [Calothrix sp. C42_A2020_038]|nr:hypothetical protein [Calothrix sp. C42_A2020_038]